jgi:hypothetical protein
MKVSQACNAPPTRRFDPALHQERLDHVLAGSNSMSSSASR